MAFEYPVHFTRNVFDPANALLESVLGRLGERRRHRAAVYVDRGLLEGHPGLLERIEEYFHSRPAALELAGAPQVLPGGEAAKNGWAAVREVLWTIGNLHLDRQSYVLAVGGGAVLDMVGFAASIVHRGLRLVRMPTTTLSQCDGGVGVKNGMNEHGMKNFIGTFAPPFAVLNDFSFLPTLSQEHWLGGVAEAFKVALIKDAGFVDFLCAHASEVRRRDAATMETIVRRTAMLHLAHIAAGGDPFEFGSARPLDFGHWAAHKLETMSSYSISHGLAVAVGVALDSCYAQRQGLLRSEDLERVLRAMAECGLPIWSDLLARRTPEGVLEVLEGLAQFREHLGGALTVTLPRGVGEKVEVHQMNPQVIEESIAFLGQRSGA